MGINKKILSNFDNTSTITPNFAAISDQNKLEKIRRNEAIQHSFENGYEKIDENPFVDSDGTLGVGSGF